MRLFDLRCASCEASLGEVWVDHLTVNWCACDGLVYWLGDNKVVSEDQWPRVKCRVCRTTNMVRADDRQWQTVALEQHEYRRRVMSMTSHPFHN